MSPIHAPHTRALHLLIPLPHRAARHVHGVRRYGRRVWVCLVFSLIAFLQGLAWNTYGPIATNVKAIYGWDDADIALLPNVQGIVVLTLAIPFAAFQHKLDLRTAVLFTATFSAVCLGVRCVPCRTTDHYNWAMGSMVANGISNAVNAVFPPVLSATWFPHNERTVATAIMTVFNFAGNAPWIFDGWVWVCTPRTQAHDPFAVVAAATAVRAWSALSQTHSQAHTHMYTHARTHARTHTHTHAHTHTHRHTCRQTHARTHVCIPQTRVLVVATHTHDHPRAAACARRKH